MASMTWERLEATEGTQQDGQNSQESCEYVTRQSKDNETLGYRYLGSKSRLSEWICSVLGVPGTSKSRFVDLFSGTGIVSKGAASYGWPILANDHLYCAAVMTQAQLASQQTIKFSKTGGYKATVTELNTLPGIEGFIWREYSPSGKSKSRQLRYYFISENAARIDAIRAKIADWGKSDSLSSIEEAVLLAALLSAANRVANIAGTYGCFLKPWQPNALRPLVIKCQQLMPNNVRAEVRCVDANSIHTSPDDVAYLDPPYTKRQHAAYYHVLETIALGDEPEVGGVTGLRPWQNRTSDFCYRSRAKMALAQAITRLSCNRILLSYSSEGHLSVEEVIDVLKAVGTVIVHPAKTIARYCSNGVRGHSSLSVREFLFEVQR